MPRTVFFSSFLWGKAGVFRGEGKFSPSPPFPTRLDPTVCWQCDKGHVCRTKVQTNHIHCFFPVDTCRHSWEDLPHLVRFRLQSEL